MDKNQTYIQNLKMEEVPWHRITTAYGRASDFPDLFRSLQDMTRVKVALAEIISNIEHQGTLWHSTPFAMIFLAHIFQRAIPNVDKDTAATLIVKELLDLFEIVADCFFECEEMEHEEPLADFSDMLKEEYLWPEEYTEEEDDMRYEEWEVFPDDLFYSFYYYSYQVILFCKPALKQLQNTSLEKRAEELQELL